MLCPACGASNSDQEAFCRNCGNLFSVSGVVDAPDPAERAGLGAASEGAATPGAPSAYREGDNLMVPKDAKLPAFCIKCGQPAGDEPVLQSFRSDVDWADANDFYRSWVGWIFYLLSPVNLAVISIIRVIVKSAAESADDQFSLFVPLCAVHRQSYERFRTAAWTLFLGALPAAFLVGTATHGPNGLFAGFLTGLVIVIAASIAWRLAGPLRAAEHDRTFAIFTGAGEQFLEKLPPAPRLSG